MAVIDDDVLRAAVEAHKADAKANGEKCFSRRRVILIADLFGMKPMPMAWQMEKRGLLKRGSGSTRRPRRSISPKPSGCST